MTRQLVLASTSTYRAALLARLGLPFVSAAPQVDESPRPGEPPQVLVLRLAEAKAAALAAAGVRLIAGASGVVGRADADLGLFKIGFLKAESPEKSVDATLPPVGKLAGVPIERHVSKLKAGES